MILFQSLPGLAPYAASKAALRFWNDALRIEMKKYGVAVINFIPGSFVNKSNIFARQEFQAKEMMDDMDNEQREAYGEYFKMYNDYLKTISGFKPAAPIDDEVLLGKFLDALTSTRPKSMYIHEPFRYID